jgi:hypothetical protein
MYIGLHIKYPLSLSDFNKTLIKFLEEFSENSQMPSCIKVRLVGSEFFLADRQTDMMKLIVAFCNLANEFKKDLQIRCRWGQEPKHVENIMFIMSCHVSFPSFNNISGVFFYFVLWPTNAQLSHRTK